LRAERRGDRNIDALTASMFSGDLTGRGTPALRFVALAVRLNVVTHVTLDLRSGTKANGALLKRFRNTRCVLITEHPLEKYASTAKARSSHLTEWRAF